MLTEDSLNNSRYFYINNGLHSTEPFISLNIEIILEHFLQFKRVNSSICVRKTKEPHDCYSSCMLDSSQRMRCFFRVDLFL